MVSRFVASHPPVHHPSPKRILIDHRTQNRPILITNDDGYDAPGLIELAGIVRRRYPRRRMIVVAPDRQRSECGHGVTQGRPLRVTRTDEDWYSVDALPADCVRVALTGICPEISLVYSGINAGANLGIDLLCSGTMAAAREAALRGRHAMAVSHYRKPGIEPTWDHAGRWLQTTLQEWDQTVEAALNARASTKLGLLWNVNLPALDPATEPPTSVICSVDSNSVSDQALYRDGIYRPQIDFHNRPRDPGTDVDRCFAGELTISRIDPRIVSRCD